MDNETMSLDANVFLGPSDICLYLTNPTLAGDNGSLLSSVHYTPPKPQSAASVTTQGGTIAGTVTTNQDWCDGDCSWQVSAAKSARPSCPAHEARIVAWRGKNWSGLGPHTDNVLVYLGPYATSGTLCFYVTNSDPATTTLISGAPFQQSQQEIAAGCTGIPVRPHSLPLGCRGGQFEARRLKYQSYGGDTATATGFVGRRSCKAACATVPATLKLYDPRTIDGTLSYTEVAWKYGKQPLPGLPASGRRSITTGYRGKDSPDSGV